MSAECPESGMTRLYLIAGTGVRRLEGVSSERGVSRERCVLLVRAESAGRGEITEITGGLKIDREEAQRCLG